MAGAAMRLIAAAAAAVVSQLLLASFVDALSMQRARTSSLAEVVFPIWASDPKRENLTGRARYIDEKLAFERKMLASIPPLHQTVSDDSEAPAKVAFLFMLMEDVDWPLVWDSFFEGAPSDTFSVYLHIADREGKRQSHERNKHRRTKSAEHLPFARWGAVNVAKVKTEWCALMGVEVALMHAALEDPRNQQLVLVSHDTVPLKAFPYVYSELVVESPDTSKFCFAEKAHHNMLMQEALVNEVTRGCFFRDYYSAVNPRTLKHHQWVVLARDHAMVVCKHAHQALDRWAVSWRRAAPDVGNMAEGCSDEAVPAAALLMDVEKRNASTENVWRDFEQMGVKQQCLTLVQWHNCFRGTELELPPGQQMDRAQELEFLYEHMGDLLKFLKPGDYDWLESPVKRSTNEFPHSFSNTTLAYLRLAVQHGFMFARKFPAGLQVIDESGHNAVLSEVLPSLWDTVDEEAARARVWTRNGFEGRPVAVHHNDK